MNEAKILNAIADTMTCDKCPSPCKAKQNASKATCVQQWSEILSKINPNANWKEVCYEVAELNTSDEPIFAYFCDLGSAGKGGDGMKKVPLYLCDKKRDCNGPCYRYCRLTHDINHAVRDDEGNPIIEAYLEDPGDTWSGFKEVEK